MIKFLNGMEMPFSRHETAVEEDGKVKYKIHQYPFILAYALSIHKVQGSTLDYAVIDIGYSVFEASMSYVALSRVRSLEGLFIQAFHPSKIFCNKEAIEFYDSIGY
jgi:ATP-dependent DNA helicase PIF1